MSLLVVVRYYPTLSETFVVREIAELLRRGVRVRVLALGERADGGLADGLPEVEVIRPARGLHLVSAMVRSGSFQKRSARLAAWIRAAGEVTRVHAHFAGEAAEWGLALAEALQVPCSVVVHAADLFKPRAGLGALLHRVQVLTVCEHHRAWIQSRYGVEATVVRCGVPMEDRPLAAPERDPPTVIAVARDVPKKDLDRLVRAVRGKARLRLVSDVPRLASAGVEIGACAPSQVAGLLASAQLFALPVRVAPDLDRDGVPVAMMEAMAAGLPVVTRPVSGVPELVDDSVGWIAEDFERSLDQALANPTERRERGRAARERVATQWTLRQSVDATLAAWARLRA